MAHSCTLCLWNSSSPCSIFSDTKFNHSLASKLLCYSLFPYTSVLGFSIQVQTWTSWSSISHWYVILVECDFTWTIHEVHQCQFKNQGPNFYGDVPRNWRILPFCNSFCCNDLVNFSSPFLQMQQSTFVFFTNVLSCDLSQP